MSSGKLFIISAPSGAGKTSLVDAIVAADPNLMVSISYTTRPQRPGEVEGKNYFFIDEPSFIKMVEEKKFLEHAQVFTNYYGTSQSWVEAQLAAGKDVILEIDWQGAQQIRHLMPESVGIFILPPSRETLERRLHDRAQDDVKVIAQRMQQASEEMSHYNEYKYLIINDDFDEAVAELQAIIKAEHLQLAEQVSRYEKQVQTLLK